MWSFLYKLASPQSFYERSRKMLPWFIAIGLVLFAYGLIDGLLFVPADYQQGDAFRIIYIHVPSAFMSLGVFSFMAFCACLSLIWQIKLADIMIKVAAPLGAWFTALALVTGSLWGKPMWGTWWIWDARLTSELLLFFIYIGIIALQNALAGQVKAGKAVAIMVLVGAVDIPIIHYSVYWWNTLHQGATVSLFAQPKIAPDMLMPLLAMLGAFACYFAVNVLQRARSEVLQREYRADWVNKLLA